MALLDIQKFDKKIDVSQLAAAVYGSLASLEDQLNQRSQIYVNADGVIPNGAAPNADFIATIAKDGKMALAIPQGKGSTRNLNITDLGGPYQTPLPLNFVGETTSTAVPSTTEYPNAGDYGFHNNTTLATPGQWYLAINVDGATIEYVDLFANGTFKTTNFVGVTTTAAAPTITEYPNNKDWGFHKNTAGGGVPDLYLAFNRSGVVENIPFNPDPFVNTQFLGKTVTTAVPSLTEYPNPNDWGFHNQTTGNKIWLTYNQAGTIFKVQLL